MALDRARIVAAGVDWTTTTSSPGNGANLLWGLGERLVSLDETEGQHPTRWHGHGYVGWSTSHVAFGSRLDGTYLRLSAQKSRDHWREAVTAAENCTRIDLAVDVHLDNPVASVARELYSENCPGLRHGGRPPGKKLVIDTNGGSTCYFGARSSARFGRVYDKGRETKTLPAGLWWRWELEHKAECAAAAGDGMVASAAPHSTALSAVVSWFRQRGTAPPCQLTESANYIGNRNTPDDERLLHWLSVGVRPTVSKLTDRLGLVRVLHALGIPLRSAVDADGVEHTLEEARQCPQRDRFTK